MLFVCLRVNSERSIDALLILFALRAKPFQHIRINIERNGHFFRYTQFGVGEKAFIKRRDVRGVDLFIGQRVNSRPVGL